MAFGTISSANMLLQFGNPNMCYINSTWSIWIKHHIYYGGYIFHILLYHMLFLFLRLNFKLEFCNKFCISFHTLSHFILTNCCEIFLGQFNQRFLVQCNLSLTALEYYNVDQLLEDDRKTAHFENRLVVGSGGKSQISGLAIADVACLNNQSLGCGCQNCSSIKTFAMQC